MHATGLRWSLSTKRKDGGCTDDTALLMTQALDGWMKSR